MTFGKFGNVILLDAQITHVKHFQRSRALGQSLHQFFETSLSKTALPLKNTVIKRIKTFSITM